MEVRIDGIDFWNAEAMKYYSFPKKFSQSEKKEKAKYMCLSGDYWGAIKVDGAWAMLIRDNDGIFHLRSRAPSVNGGYVDKVLITTTDNEYFLIKAMVRDMRLPELGDKFSSRHGQKGVVGLITGQVIVFLLFLIY